MKTFLSICAAVFGFGANTVYAAYVPLIGEGTFTGIKADTEAAALGLVSLLLVIVGVGLLIKVFSR